MYLVTMNGIQCQELKFVSRHFEKAKTWTEHHVTENKSPMRDGDGYHYFLVHKLASGEPKGPVARYEALRGTEYRWSELPEAGAK